MTSARRLEEPRHQKRGFKKVFVYNQNLRLIVLKLKDEKMKNKEVWKTVINVVITILTAIVTTFGTTSCMGHGPLF